MDRRQLNSAKLYLPAYSNMEIVLSTIVLTAAVSSMEIGIIISDKPLSCSCGSQNSDGVCNHCITDQKHCEYS